MISALTRESPPLRLPEVGISKSCRHAKRRTERKKGATIEETNKARPATVDDVLAISTTNWAGERGIPGRDHPEDDRHVLQ